MTARKFSKGEAIRFGWNIAKSHLGFFLVVLIVYFAVALIPAWITARIEPKSAFEWVLYLGIAVARVILGLVVGLGLVRVGLRFTDNEPAAVGDLFSPSWSQVVANFIASILATVIVGVGLLLLIVPGIFVATRLSMAPYLILDRRVGALDALRGSWALTQRSAWNLFLFALLALLINCLGALALGIGLLWTIPTTLVASAFIYRKLQDGLAGTAAMSVAPTPTPGATPTSVAGPA